MDLISLLGGVEMFVGAIFVLGLCVGSFLNVVVFRLPIILMRQWQAQAREIISEGGGPDLPAYTDAYPERFGLVLPNSACPHCKTPIKPWHNLPLLGWLLLRGKCAHCKASISVRYPLVELLTGGLFAFSAWHFGAQPALLAALIFNGLLVAMTFIDVDHKLLPDQLTYILLWTGLLFSLLGIGPALSSSIVGALAGYLSLWSVYWLFKLLTGKEGMGYGDFKLFAALGAWLGWQLLPMIIILAAVSGLVIGGGLMLLKRDGDRQIPFGPYLAAGGWLALYFGTDWWQRYLQIAGLA